MTAGLWSWLDESPVAGHFQPPKPLGLADIHAAILDLPLLNGCIADAVLATQIGDEHTGLVLFRNANDLIFGEPAALHLWFFRLGQSLPQTGLARGGNVSAEPVFFKLGMDDPPDFA